MATLHLKDAPNALQLTKHSKEVILPPQMKSVSITKKSSDASRREFLKVLLRMGAGVTAASLLSSCRIAVEPNPPRGCDTTQKSAGAVSRSPCYDGPQPNVVLIVVDDLAAGVMGKGSRFPFLKTPHLDRLQREGTTFDNAFVPSAICSPSRASLLTGSYPHNHGVRVNDIEDLSGALPNFPDLLRDAGYSTGFVGKWHMDNNLSHPRLNFDYWLSFAGQGVYNDPTFNENGRTFQARGYVTDLITDYAVEFIQEPRQQPFCLILSHKAGHLPFTAAPRHKRALRNARLPEPPNFQETFAGKPEWQRRYKECGLGREGWEACKEVPEKLPLERWRPYDRAKLEHLRTLLAVDDSLGRVFDALEFMEQLDNTVFIFTSDNGFMLGAHRLSDKRVMYEEAIRVPLTIRYPGRFKADHHVKQLVSTLDLAPTVLELGQQNVPETMLGKSLLLLNADANAQWRDRILYEYFQGHMDAAVPTMFGVRTERWKYVTYPELQDDIDELYDLESDPYELNNLINNSAYAATVGELSASLQQQLADTGYENQLASL